MKFISILFFMIAFGFASASFAYADENNNPWRSLAPDTRNGIRPFLLTPADPKQTIATDVGFQNWYRTFYSAPGSAKPEEVYPEYRYNALSLPERVAGACVFQQVYTDLLKNLGHPMVGTASIVYGDQQGSLIMRVSDVKALKDDLLKANYTADYCAGPKDPLLNIYCGEGGPPKVWGLRGQVNGQALHWYQTQAMVDAQQVSVHIDYYNPGTEAEFKIASLGEKAFDFDVVNAFLDIHRADLHIYNDLLKWGDRNMIKLMDSQPNHCGLGKNDIDAATKETNENIPESEWTKILKKIPNPISSCP